MAEYVKRDDAHRALEQINPVDYGAMWDYEAHHYAGECIRDCKEAIDSIPAADVAPVMHGRWVSVAGKRDRICSRCLHNEPYKNAADDAEVFEFCPHCGAKMDGGDTDAAN
jgi:hypothetical protein